MAQLHRRYDQHDQKDQEYYRRNDHDDIQEIADKIKDPAPKAACGGTAFLFGRSYCILHIPLVSPIHGIILI